MLDYIFSLDFWQTVLRMTTPVLFASMAATIGDKANVLCIGYEGIMLFAALGGVIGSAYTQSLILGMLLGIVCGLILTFIFSYFVLYLGTRPLLAGLAINTLSSGITIYIVYLLTGMKLNTSSLESLQFPVVEIPVIKDLPVIGPMLSGYNLLTYLAFISVFLTWFMLYRTKFGLRVRAVGKDPERAESVGINVNRTKMIALLISGVMASFGGMFMSMGYLKYFQTEMIAGRGSLGIAAQRLGFSNPLRVMFVTVMFGLATAIGNMAQIYRMPSQFASMLPYAVTVVTLAVTGEINLRRARKVKKARDEGKESKDETDQRQ